MDYQAIKKKKKKNFLFYFIFILIKRLEVFKTPFYLIINNK